GSPVSQPKRHGPPTMPQWQRTTGHAARYRDYFLAAAAGFFGGTSSLSILSSLSSFVMSAFAASISCHISEQQSFRMNFVPAVRERLSVLCTARPPVCDRLIFGGTRAV